MVEVFVALGLGGVLGFILGGPKLTARQRTAKAMATPIAPVPAQVRRSLTAVAPPPTAAPAAAEASPRKATQTVRKFK